MKRSKTLLAILLAVSLPMCLAAQTADESTFTLEQCLETAVQSNPLILSSLQQHVAARARIRQALAFAQPSLDYDSDLQPKFFNFQDTAETYFGVSQSFEFPGKRFLRGKIASREADELMAEIDLLILDIAFQVKEAFYNLLLAQEKHQYASQNLELSQDFLQKTKLKHEAGDVARVEVLRASVEAARAANEVRSASNEVNLGKARLNYLLARRKFSPIEVEGELKRSAIPLNLEGLNQKALSFRPEVKKIEISIKRESLQKTQAIMNYLPDLDLSVSKHWIDGEGSFWDATLSVPIPLFFWQPARGEVAEAQANIHSLLKEAEHIKNSVALEVEEAFTTALTAHNQIQLFEEEILTQAEEVYNMFLFSYQEGEIGGIELIDARRTMMEARISYADALFNYDVALAALEKSIGYKLEGDAQ